MKMFEFYVENDKVYIEYICDDLANSKTITLPRFVQGIKREQAGFNRYNYQHIFDSLQPSHIYINQPLESYEELFMYIEQTDLTVEFAPGTLLQSGANSVKQMFHKARFLRRLKLINFDTMNIEDFSCFLLGTNNLFDFDLSTLDFRNARSLNRMFYSCGLRDIDFQKHNLDKVALLQFTFYCSRAKRINFGNNQLPQAIDLTGLFERTMDLEELHFELTKLTCNPALRLSFADILKGSALIDNPNRKLYLGDNAKNRLLYFLPNDIYNKLFYNDRGC